jgi:hypothetical protein
MMKALRWPVLVPTQHQKSQRQQLGKGMHSRDYVFRSSSPIIAIEPLTAHWIAKNAFDLTHCGL